MDIFDKQKAAEVYLRQHAREYERFREKTNVIIKGADDFPKDIKRQKKYHIPELKELDGKFKYTNSALNSFSAHAGYSCDNGFYGDEFVNIKGSLSHKNCFPGVKLIANECESDRDIEYFGKKERIRSDKLCYLKSRIEAKNKKCDFYLVAYVGVFMAALDDFYEKNNKTSLHPMTKYLIECHLRRNNCILPTKAGIAGLHAEVQALNHLFIKTDQSNNIITESVVDKSAYTRAMLNSVIFTKRLTPKQERGKNFPACHNCAGILELACIATGVTHNPQDSYSDKNKRGILGELYAGKYNAN